MSCLYCEFVTPGLKCPECGTRKPKQVPSRDLWALMVVMFLLVFLIWRVEEMTKRCDFPPYLEQSGPTLPDYHSANWREP